MENCILILSMTAIFIFGYWIMKKLDIFLDENYIKETSSPSVLRIAFETPVMVDSMTDLLNHFSRENPNCEMQLFYGSAKEIKCGVENQEFDFGVLADWLGDGLKKEFLSLSIPIKQSAITSESIGMTVQPLNKTEKQTKVIWEPDNNHTKAIFLNLLRAAS